MFVPHVQVLSQRSTLRGRKVNAARAAPVRSQRAVAARADGGYIGSSTNIIFVTSTTLLLAAGRFGLMPSSFKKASAGEN